ncbi:MAG: DUF4190 domain-containing protein [Planctomycetota bacterium]
MRIAMTPIMDTKMMLLDNIIDGCALLSHTTQSLLRKMQMMQETPPTKPGPIEPQHPFSSTGLARTSMILGIVGLVSSGCYCISVPCAILAICFGVTAKKRIKTETGSDETMAKWGIICGILTVGVLIIITIISIIAGDFEFTLK